MSTVKIGRITMGMYMTNCYFIYRDDLKEAVVIDPADSGAYLYDKLTENGLKITAILLTHGHFDHIFGCNDLKKKADVKVYAGEAEEKLLEDEGLNCSESVGRPVRVTPDVLLKDEETVEISGMKIKVLHTPGHTAGSVCFYLEEAGFLIAGDTLFCESVGRTDLPTGNSGKLIESIRTKIFKLPDDTKVYPGHGDATTVVYEKQYNPFAGIND